MAISKTYMAIPKTYMANIKNLYGQYQKLIWQYQNFSTQCSDSASKLGSSKPSLQFLYFFKYIKPLCQTFGHAKAVQKQPEHSNIRDTRRALGYLGIPLALGGHLDIKALGHLGQSDAWALR